jgi:glucokinase
LGNDCDCAALAEACFGAGKGKRSLFYVTVGTGIGGGLVIDRKVHGTDRPAAAEIGHLRPFGGLPSLAFLATPSRSRVRSGPYDLESVAAGPGITTRLLQMIEWARQANPEYTQDIRDLLHRCKGSLERLTTRQIAEAAQGGNQLAKGVFDQATRSLGWAVAQVITLIAPEVVVIGGGVSLAGEELFFEPLRDAVDEFVFEQLRGSAEIVPASLGESVVVHGALALAAS